MRSVFAACVVVAVAGPVAADDYPHVYLKNDKLKVKVYLPDAEKGFYRGTRFDWAGVCGEVEFAGHKLFGPWKDTHDPTNHDDIVGPCEAFGIEKPLGYDEAKVGDTFLKIGVGELEKPKEEKYSFATRYKIVKPAEWKVGIEPRKGNTPETIRWAMEAALPNGFAYRYSKEIYLDINENDGAAMLVISHGFKNTGTRPITTDFYNHNFFNVDGDPIGPNYSLEFTFPVKPVNTRGKFDDCIRVAGKDGKELQFKEKLTDGFVMAGLTSTDPQNSLNFGFFLRHAPSRLRVTVLHTYEMSKLNVWGVKTVICPEPFLRIEQLKPGERKAWFNSYSFRIEATK